MGKFQKFQPCVLVAAAFGVVFWVLVLVGLVTEEWIAMSGPEGDFAFGLFDGSDLCDCTPQVANSDENIPARDCEEYPDSRKTVCDRLIAVQVFACLSVIAGFAALVITALQSVRMLHKDYVSYVSRGLFFTAFLLVLLTIFTFMIAVQPLSGDNSLYVRLGPTRTAGILPDLEDLYQVPRLAADPDNVEVSYGYSFALFFAGGAFFLCMCCYAAPFRNPCAGTDAQTRLPFVTGIVCTVAAILFVVATVVNTWFTHDNGATRLEYGLWNACALVRETGADNIQVVENKCRSTCDTGSLTGEPALDCAVQAVMQVLQIIAVILSFIGAFLACCMFSNKSGAAVQFAAGCVAIIPLVMFSQLGKKPAEEDLLNNEVNLLEQPYVVSISQSDTGTGWVLEVIGIVLCLVSSVATFLFLVTTGQLYGRQQAAYY